MVSIMNNPDDIDFIIRALGFSSALLSNRLDDIKSLLNDLSRNIISSSDMSEQLKIMTKRELILKQPKDFCAIWHASDGRYKTKVPTATGGKKLIARSTQENLENLIVEHYKKLEQKTAKPCMRSIYPEWLDFKSKETSYANACNLQSRWKRYFEKSTIVDIPFDKLTTGAIKKWCVDVISDMHLTDRQFKDLKSIMNMIFDYAVSFDIIQINLSRQVRGFSDKNFKQEKAKPVSELVYTTQAKHSVLSDAMQQFLKTQNTAYLAVCLNFTLGLRVGELVALRTSHINDDGTISIKQEEVKTYFKNDAGKFHRNGYEIVDHTKTLSGNRRLVLTPKAKKYIDMALKYNCSHGLKDYDFIFLDKNGNRLHDHAINNVLRRLNGVRNEKDAFIINDRPSGNHSIRRTTISEIHDAMVVSEDTLKTFAGHKDISTTQKCYIHQVKDITEYADQFAKVLDS